MSKDIRIYPFTAKGYVESSLLPPACKPCCWGVLVWNKTIRSWMKKSQTMLTHQHLCFCTNIVFIYDFSYNCGWAVYLHYNIQLWITMLTRQHQLINACIFFSRHVFLGMHSKMYVDRMIRDSTKCKLDSDQSKSSLPIYISLLQKKSYDSGS